MIALLSKENFDLSTDEVMDWLDHYNAHFLRLNGEDFTKSDKTSTYTINDECNTLTLMIDGTSVNLSEVSIIWFRRWIRYGEIREKISKLNLEKNLTIGLKDNLIKEIATFSISIFKYFDDKKWLDHPIHVGATGKKIELLKIAQSIGLKIPSTIISNNKKDIKAFFDTHQRVITKPIAEVQYFIVEEKAYPIRTQEIYYSDIENAQNLFLSLFQELIEKTYELRIFYLDGAFYSMAIFSQNDQQTQVDFRNYNFEKSNRMIPYQLSKEIEDKLKLLFKDLQLTHGSVDIIRNTKGEYIFLEVNPVGQFGMVSKPCNYYLEEKIAQYLMHNQ